MATDILILPFKEDKEVLLVVISNQPLTVNRSNSGNNKHQQYTYSSNKKEISHKKKASYV